MKLFAPSYPFLEANTTMTYTELAMTASTHKASFIFTVPKTGTISSVSYYYAGTSGTHTMTVGLYTVDSSGNPTTTAYGGMAPQTASASSFTARNVTLATPATAVKGDMVAFVISFSSYGGAGYVRIAGTANSVMGSYYPYGLTYNGASWTKRTNARPTLGLFYNDNTCPLTIGFDSSYPVEGVLTSAQKVGNRYVPASNVYLHGCVMVIKSSASHTYRYFVETYSGNTRIQQHDLKTDQMAHAAAQLICFLQFFPRVQLTKDVSYVIGIEQVTGGSNYTMVGETGEDGDFRWFEQAANLTTWSNTVRTTGSWATTDHHYNCVWPIVEVY